MEWTFDGYWNAVLGANRGPRSVIDEFDLDPTNKRTLSDWLSDAEAEAWRVGGDRPTQDQCYVWHEKALAMLQMVMR